MNLIEHLKIVEDPRTDINIQHNLLDVLFLTLSAVLSGATGWKSVQEFGEEQLEWLRNHRPFEHGIPKRHCIANIIRALDSDILQQAVLNWLNEIRQKDGKTVIAMDGKTMRGAWKVESQKALHVVSAYDVTNGLALYQNASNSKGSEASVARDMLDALVLDNAIVTLDALHCQKSTMEKIVQQKGDFVIQVKSNQPKLLEAIQGRFKAAYNDPELATFEQTNTGHGRQEQRAIMQMKAELPAELKEKWSPIKSIIEVASERTQAGKTACSSRWYVSSLDVEPESLAQIIREHWAVENQLHWVLDVVFREDGLKVSDPDGARHLAQFNRMALNVLRQHKGKKDSLAGKRRRAGWNPAFRTELLFG